MNIFITLLIFCFTCFSPLSSTDTDEYCASAENVFAGSPLNDTFKPFMGTPSPTDPSSPSRENASSISPSSNPGKPSSGGSPSRASFLPLASSPSGCSGVPVLGGSPEQAKRSPLAPLLPQTNFPDKSGCVSATTTRAMVVGAGYEEVKIRPRAIFGSENQGAEGESERRSPSSPLAKVRVLDSLEFGDV